MSDLNQHQKQFLTDTMKKLGSAMDKIEFNRAMSADEESTIRKVLAELKGDLFMFGDINPDIKHLELFKQSVELVEKVLNTLIKPYEHLI